MNPDRSLTDVPEDGPPMSMAASATPRQGPTTQLLANNSAFSSPSGGSSSMPLPRIPKKSTSMNTLGEKSSRTFDRETLSPIGPSQPGGPGAPKSIIKRNPSGNSVAGALSNPNGSSSSKDKEERERELRPSRSHAPLHNHHPGQVPASPVHPITPHQQQQQQQQRLRANPRLPHDVHAVSTPASVMYWSKAPTYGFIPMRNMRAHSVTLIDQVAWLFGGCDERDCWKDVYCFDADTMQWSHPDTQGDIPPPCRAHTATLVDRKIVIIGGGQGPQYYNDVYVLDTTTRRWTKPSFDMSDPSKIPAPRRAHTAVLYQNKIWVFGGGNGMEALNDVWTLDVGVPIDQMRWAQVKTSGKPPGNRGYHTANLIGEVMVVVGGSDGKECFSDVWTLNLETLEWKQPRLQITHRRLSHTSTQVGSYLFIMGGHDGREYTNSILLFNLVSLQYEDRPVNGKPPSPRGYHATVLHDSRLFVFGGFNGSSVYDDVFTLDLAAAAYLPQVTSFSIPQ